MSCIVLCFTLTQLLTMAVFLSPEPEGPPLSVTSDSSMTVCHDQSIITSINVWWNPPDVALQSGVINRYTVLYTTDDSLPWGQRSSLNVSAADCSQPQSTNIPKLRAQSRYYISVSAGTSAGFGPYANISGYPSSRRKLPDRVGCQCHHSSLCYEFILVLYSPHHSYNSWGYQC